MRTKRPSYLIRKLAQTDLAAVVEISSLGEHSNWSVETFQTCFKENYINWVLLKDHNITAFLISILNLEEIEILNLCVHPSWRRQGLADQLLGHLFEFARTQGVKRIHLEVNQNNQPAINLYQKHHFAQVGVRKGYYASLTGAQDALLFSRELA